VVTLGYWAFTLTDGALRMLVVLFLHGIGFSPLQIAMTVVLLLRADLGRATHKPRFSDLL